MNVDTMRKIDYYAGVPLCLVVTVVSKLFGVLRRRTPGAPRRVLFLELSEMGSAVLVDPALRRMRDQGGAQLFFAIFAHNAASLRLLGTVPEAQVFTIRADGLLPLVVDTLRFLLWTRRQGIDTVIDLELFSRYTALLTGMSGADRRVGFHAFHNEGLYRGALLTHRVAYNPHQHIAKNFLSLVHAALAQQEELPYSKVVFDDSQIRLAQAVVSDAQREQMQARVRVDYPDYDPQGQRLLLINPNASDLLPQRRWPPERFVAVMQALLQRHPDVLVLITGAPAERDEAQGLQERVGNPRCINFAGRVKLLELPALYHIATLLLTNDSGPGHFSAVTPIPSFVIFGPVTPALYGSLGNSTPLYAGLSCSPCVSAANHRKTPCRDNVCVQAITVEQVLAALEGVL